MTREYQVQFIKENYLKIPSKRMATILGRSGCFVSTVLKKEGLKVPEEIIEKFKNESRFKKGRESWNKGRPQKDWMSKEKIENSKKTRFKKGEDPHNTKEEYSVSIRSQGNYPYYYFRLAKANWVLFHRWLFEKINGPIPDGYNVQFKDGNSLNCDIENLYLIHRKDQSIINKKGGRKIPHELRKTILLINNLNKNIIEKQDNRPK